MVGLASAELPPLNSTATPVWVTVVVVVTPPFVVVVVVVVGMLPAAGDADKCMRACLSHS
jgi:hypothetical protein